MLVAANLLPLAGVAFLGWRVHEVVFLYWIENVVIGVFNVLRMLYAIGPSKAGGEPLTGFTGVFMKAFTVPFFVVHYGGFCFGHGMFLATLFPGNDKGERDLDDILLAALGNWEFDVAVLLMVLSHGYSFKHHYLGGGEYRRRNLDDQMMRPYKRILVTQLFILTGGVLLLALKSPLPAILLFIGLKIAFDAFFHRRERAAEAASVK